tara:strand:+ start:1430 stop:1744 length:315 start_codon:yes stop_codon:yes gene_type:complete
MQFEIDGRAFRLGVSSVDNAAYLSEYVNNSWTWLLVELIDKVINKTQTPEDFHVEFVAKVNKKLDELFTPKAGVPDFNNPVDELEWRINNMTAFNGETLEIKNG